MTKGESAGASEELRELPGIGPVWYRKGSKTEVNFIYREVFVNRDYLQHGITLKPGDTVFDVGANIGLFALFADSECRGDCQLFCFEPIPETFAFLRKTLREHGLADKPSTRLLNVGLTHTGGAERARFTYFPSLPGNSTQYVTEKKREIDSLRRVLSEPRIAFEMVGPMPLWKRLCLGLVYAMAFLFSPLLRRVLAATWKGQEVECALVTLSAILNGYHVATVDLLKIDVEGAELDVLNGIADADWPRIRQVSMEAHTVDGRADRIVALLEARGFRVTTQRPKWARTPAFFDSVSIYARRA